MAYSTKIDKLERETKLLESDQKKYNRFAWVTTSTGIVLFVSGWIIRYFFPTWELESLGSYLSGTAGAIWGFSGLLFIYLGFLGQKQEIKNQQIELILTRDEMTETRKEIAGQRNELTSQREAIQAQLKEFIKQNENLSSQHRLARLQFDFESTERLLNDLKSFLETTYHNQFSVHQLIQGYFSDIQKALSEKQKLARENVMETTEPDLKRKLIKRYNFILANVCGKLYAMDKTTTEFSLLLNKTILTIEPLLVTNHQSLMMLVERDDKETHNKILHFTDIPYTLYILKMQEFLLNEWEFVADKTFFLHKYNDEK